MNLTCDVSADGVWTGFQAMQGAARTDDPFDTLVVSQGHCVWMGLQSNLPTCFARLPVWNAEGRFLTPGLVECHTHLVYGGQRAHEFAQRLDGVSYEAIAKAGGGIVSTVKATRLATEDELFSLASGRLERLLAEGVCAVEIKSGYGLTWEHERKQLRVARRLAAHYGVTVVTTFLGAHALAPEYVGRSDAYIDLVCNEMMPRLHDEGLVDAVDVFCERIGFTLAQTERVFKKAQGLGLPVKLHAEQLSDMSGSALAAQYGALSCDHLEHLSASGIAAMKRAGTVAVLLPGAFYFLRDTQVPPIEALRCAGVPMAVSTDHNPGTSPTLSPLLMMNMACTLFRLTVQEVLAGVTRHAAQALGLGHSHGQVGLGQPAEFVLWDVQQGAELAYGMGLSPACVVVRQGRLRQRAHFLKGN